MIVVLVGTIACGKSTYAKQLAESGYLVINDDSIVESVHGGIYLSYDKKLKPLYKAIEHTILEYSIILGKSVVVDRGLNITRNSRRRYIALAHALDVPISAVVWQPESAKTHAQRRWLDNGRGHSLEYWIEVAQSHIARYEVPKIDEGFDSVKFMGC